MADKVYIGSWQTKTFQVNGEEKRKLRVGLSKDDLDKLYYYLNDKGYVNIDIFPRKEVGKYGDTHSGTVDTYHFDKREGSVENAMADDYAPQTRETPQSTQKVPQNGNMGNSMNPQSPIPTSQPSNDIPF